MRTDLPLDQLDPRFAASPRRSIVRDDDEDEDADEKEQDDDDEDEDGDEAEGPG